MSQFNIYVKLKPFVAQFLEHSLGKPITFPPQSVENSTIHHFVMRLPAGQAPATAQEGLTPIAIPDSKSKPAAYFNHIGPRGRAAVAECCEYLFMRTMWNELGDMSDIGCNTSKAIYAWCEMHGVAMDYADTIRQRYYRLRDAYAKRGINLMKKHRSRNEE